MHSRVYSRTGLDWASTSAKIASDLSNSNMPKINIAWIRPGANDISVGTPASSLFSSIRDTIENQFLARGIKVVLITSHTRNPLNSNNYLQEYAALASFFDSLSLEYSGLVMHANTYASFGVNQLTPVEYLLDTQHLNESGTSRAIDAMEDVCRVWGRACWSDDPEDYGEVILDINPNNTADLTTSSATIGIGTLDSGKNKRFLLTGTANGGRVIQSNLVSGKALNPGDLCRLWCNMTLESGTAQSSIYMAGVGIRASSNINNSKRFGTYSSGATLGPYNGDVVKGMSRIFTIPESMVETIQLYVTSGAGTNAIQVGRCALIRVKKYERLGTPERTYDPISKLSIPDPRKMKHITATLIDSGTTNVNITNASELLMVGSNSNVTLTAMSVSMMDGSITKEVVSENSQFVTKSVSIPRPVGDSATIVANTNSAGFAITIGE